MTNFYCEYCGTKKSSVSGLTSSNCHNHPLGFCKGPHALYQGSEKTKYICKYCGTSNSTISGLTEHNCQKHPLGFCKGIHAPAL